MRFLNVVLFTTLLDWTSAQSLVDAAIASSPTIARLELEAAAARERVAPASALPNPMLMGGVQNLQVDLRDDEMMTMTMVGASQTFTRPSKRETRRAIAEAEVRAAEARVGTARAELERDVRLGWYDVAAADSALEATNRIREVVDAVIAAARVRYEVGTSMQSDVIRAQFERSNLEHEILGFRGARSAALARLLPLLDLPLTTEVPRLALPDVGQALLPVPPENGQTETGQTGVSVVHDHPALEAAAAEVAAAEQTIRLIELEAKPDFGVQASYGFRRTQTDMVSVVATVELPFRRSQTIDPRVREAMAQRDAAKQRIEEIRRALTQALGVAAAEHGEATQQLHLHHAVLVPQARLMFESTLAAYQTGKAPFDAILTTQSAYLRLELEYYEILARHARAVVQYEALRRGAQP